MLDKAETLKGFKLDCKDGEIGKVKEFYFDDVHWAIRYLVADTGDWIAGRQVLISPHALGAVDNEKRLISVDLTKEQIEDSPSLTTDKPVSRQFEESYHGYYGWPTYWGGPDMWGSSPDLLRPPVIPSEPSQSKNSWNPHLRSTYNVRGHHIQAVDGEIGHVEDFLIDDDNWAIRYLIVATRNWWPGKKILISPRWVTRVSWPELKVFVNLRRETIKQSPEYEEESLVTREYEMKLHHHYDCPGYWVEDSLARKSAAFAHLNQAEIPPQRRPPDPPQSAAPDR